MDPSLFEKWLGKPKVMFVLPREDERVLFVDNASGHKMKPRALTALQKSRAKLYFNPKNATDLCQTADSIIKKKSKTLWRRKRKVEKLEIIRNGHKMY